MNFLQKLKAMFGQAKGFENITTKQFKNLMEKDNAIIIDVRSSREVESGMIDGAININVMSGDFDEKIAKIEKGKTYLVYCRSGNRSGIACAKMAEMGYSNLYNLAGGVQAWSVAESLV
jgi:rhodanese-related sulfurtransferase